MIKGYLEERRDILNNIIRENREKYEHNQIAITKANNKIKDLGEIVDEASQIFSVKAREDNGFKNQEISDLEGRIAAYVIENKEYEKNIANARKELSLVEQCLKEIEEKISEKEKEEKASDKEKEEKIGEKKEKTNENEKEEKGQQLDFEDMFNELSLNTENIEIIKKLEFCKSIAEIDSKRVVIELDNIINSIKE